MTVKTMTYIPLPSFPEWSFGHSKGIYIFQLDLDRPRIPEGIQAMTVFFNFPPSLRGQKTVKKHPCKILPSSCFTIENRQKGQKIKNAAASNELLRMKLYIVKPVAMEDKKWFMQNGKYFNHRKGDLIHPERKSKDRLVEIFL